ncbi:MAG: hypothetical protein GC137_05815 [Alphaproteobacteria bacterium]|nr:hypothetical protein [Alphaproteobacteria bacterium]
MGIGEIDDANRFRQFIEDARYELAVAEHKAAEQPPGYRRVTTSRLYQLRETALTVQTLPENLADRLNGFIESLRLQDKPLFSPKEVEADAEYINREP